MNRKLCLYLVLAALALALLATVGCSRQPENRSDAQIAADVQNKINADANIPNKQITINANAGVVTLSGNVGSDMERSAAANTAAQVEGVKTVINNLTVGQEQAAPAPAEVAPVPTPVPGRDQQQARSTQQPRSVTSGLRKTVPQRQTSAASDLSAAPASTASSAVPAAAPAPQRVTLPEGTQLTIRTVTPINSETAQVGDSFQATLDQPIFFDDQVVVPDNADVEGRVIEVKSAGKFKGQSELRLALTRIIVNGRSYQINTDEWFKQGSSRGKNTAAKVGGGAALGAIIGGIAGGGKGAAIGAAAGAGAGTGVQAITKGQQIELAPETVLNFRLQAPVSVIPASQRTR